MAKEYKEGDRYYLPVCVNEIDSGYLYSVRIAFNNGDGNNEGHNAIKNEPDLLLTAEEITEKRLGRAFSECYPTFEELKAKVAKLEAENDKLKAERDNLRSQVGKNLAEIQDLNAEVHFLNAEKEKEAKAEKTVHVVLNDGTGYNFLKCTKASFDNYADFSVLKIYRGEEYVAGFLRGDKPGNLAYWWTE